MDEVTYLVTLLEEEWDDAITALGSEIPAIHRVHPQIMDIRDMSSTRNTSKPGRGGNRVRISKATETTAGGVTNSTDLLVVMENSNTIEYPTRDWSVRNETYDMSVSIRTKQDDRKTNDNARLAPSGSTFGIDRLENLYKVVRYILEKYRRGWERSSGTIFRKCKAHIIMGSRSDANDKKARILDIE